MTAIGKLLVFINLFVSVALAAWATSLYANRLDWLDRQTEQGKVEGQITLLRKKIDEAAKSVADSNALYATRANALSVLEQIRGQRQGFYEKNIQTARKGEAGAFRTFQLVGGVGPLVNTANEGTPVPVPGATEADAATDPAKQLRGADAIQKDLSDSLRASGQFAKEIADLRTKQQAESDKIADLDARSAAQRVILAEGRDEERYLESQQVNWAAELDVLQVRNKQLKGRLNSLMPR